MKPGASVSFIRQAATRKLGNLGAHDDEVEIQAADVPAIEALADAILEYLYRAPATLDAVKGSLDERRAEAQA